MLDIMIRRFLIDDAFQQLLFLLIRQEPLRILTASSLLSFDRILHALDTRTLDPLPDSVLMNIEVLGNGDIGPPFSMQAEGLFTNVGLDILLGMTEIQFLGLFRGVFTGTHNHEYIIISTYFLR